MGYFKNISFKRRIVALLIGLLSFLVILAGILFGILSYHKWSTARERATWKDPMLVRLKSLNTTNELVIGQIDELKQNAAEELNLEWTHRNVILMTNSEYIVYEFRHGANMGFPDHLFLGRGSDGRWLYSTYHFCNGLQMIIGDGAPGSIDEFMSRYAVHEFDGKSDVCLERTWPEPEESVPAE